jgi:hypothetical protein
LTDRLDRWQQYLDDIQKVDDEKAASKAEEAERKLRVNDRRDDILLGLNAKRVFESIDDTDYDDNETLDSSLSQLSQRPARKRRRETPQKEKEIVVKVEAVNSLLKEDWIEIIATSKNDNTIKLQEDISSLQSTVNQLAVNSERISSLIERLLSQ